MFLTLAPFDTLATKKWLFGCRQKSLLARIKITERSSLLKLEYSRIHFEWKREITQMHSKEETNNSVTDTFDTFNFKIVLINLIAYFIFTGKIALNKLEHFCFFHCMLN